MDAGEAPPAPAGRLAAGQDGARDGPEDSAGPASDPRRGAEDAALGAAEDAAPGAEPRAGSPGATTVALTAALVGGFPPASARGGFARAADPSGGREAGGPLEDSAEAAPPSPVRAKREVGDQVGDFMIIASSNADPAAAAATGSAAAPEDAADGAAKAAPGVPTDAEEGGAGAAGEGAGAADKGGSPEGADGAEQYGDALRNYLSQHNALRGEMSSLSYRNLVHRQLREDQWGARWELYSAERRASLLRERSLNNRKRLLPSELPRASGEDLVGCPVRLYCPFDDAEHTGRIVSARRRRVGGAIVWEHLVRYVTEGPRSDLTLCEWMVLEEHMCMVGREPLWVKLPGFVWWPGQVYERTSLELFRKKAKAQKSPAGERLRHVIFFGEDSHAFVAPSQLMALHDQLAPFRTGKLDRIKSLKSSSRAHLTSGLSHALGEAAEQHRVRSAFLRGRTPQVVRHDAPFLLQSAAEDAPEEIAPAAEELGLHGLLGAADSGGGGDVGSSYSSARPARRLALLDRAEGGMPAQRMVALSLRGRTGGGPLVLGKPCALQRHVVRQRQLLIEAEERASARKVKVRMEMRRKRYRSAEPAATGEGDKPATKQPTHPVLLASLTTARYRPFERRARAFKRRKRALER